MTTMTLVIRIIYGLFPPKFLKSYIFIKITANFIANLFSGLSSRIFSKFFENFLKYSQKTFRSQGLTIQFLYGWFELSAFLKNLSFFRILQTWFYLEIQVPHSSRHNYQDISFSYNLWTVSQKVLILPKFSTKLPKILHKTFLIAFIANFLKVLENFLKYHQTLNKVANFTQNRLGHRL